MTTDLTAQRDDDFEPDEDALAAALRDQDDIPLLLDVVADNSEDDVEETVEEGSHQENSHQESFDQEISNQENSGQENLDIEPRSSAVSQEEYFMQAVVESDASPSPNEQPMSLSASSVDSEMIQVEVDSLEIVLSEDLPLEEGSLEETSVDEEVVDEFILSDSAFVEVEDGHNDAALDVELEDRTLSMSYSAEQIEEAVSQVLTQRLPELIEEVLRSLQANNSNMNSEEK